MSIISNIKYFAGVALSIPMLPLMYHQGKKIRKSVPTLPEAKGVSGEVILQGKRDHFQLITIGESTIAGVGVETHAEGFTGTLATTLSELTNQSINWKVYAKSGYTAKRVSKKLVPAIEEKAADLVVVGLGGNDAFTLNNPSRWRKDIRKLIRAIRLKFPKTPILFCNMPPIKVFPAFTPLIKFVIGNLVEVLGSALNIEVQKHEGVFYASEVITLKKWKETYGIEADESTFFSDGVHPSKLTYQTWGKYMAEHWVKELNGG